MNYKNGMKSMVFGIIQQATTILIGLIAPRLFIATFGSETNGVLNTIANIFSYLALVEAGVGTAALQAFYGTIAKKDNNASNGVLSAVHVFFKKAGFIYFIGVLLLAFFYPLSINTSLDYWTIFWLVILSGMGGVLNFWFQAKYKLYLQAEGKNYIISVLTMIVNFMTNIAKIGLILAGFNVVQIHVVYFVITLCQMGFVLWYIHRNYPWMNPHVKPNMDAITQKAAILVQQITWMICSNTDILILTYVGKDLAAVSVYAIYMMIYNMIQNIFNTIFGSFHYLLGQKYNENPEAYLSYHEIYEAISMAVTFGLYTTAYLLMEPFLKVYMYGITDAKYVDPILPLLFTIMYLLSSGREASSRVINFARHFKQMQWRAILESIINIVISIILVKRFEIYGVILGTIAAYLYRTNDIILYASNHLLGRKSLVTYKRWICNAVIFSIFVIVNQNIDLTVTSYMMFFLEVVPVFCITIGIYFISVFVYDRKVMIRFLGILKKLLLSKYERR